MYNGYYLEDFEVDKLANDQKIIDLLNNIEEELIDDAIEEEEMKNIIINLNQEINQLIYKQLNK